VRTADLSGPWVEVRKERWRWTGLEVARVSVEDQQWWTLAVELGTGRSAEELVERYPHWDHIVSGEAFIGSYPRWLLEHVVRPNAS
jgi:hypothetical protein